MERQEKTVLITGASRGIGRAAAELFVVSGYNVAINYLSSVRAAEELQSSIIEKGGTASLYRADVADKAAVDKMAAAIIAEYGSIEVLINNAGIAQQQLFTDISAEDWRRVFAVNTDGVYHCTQAVLPYMVSRKYGRIINISSVWGLTGASCEVHYSASKAAVIGLTKALAKELGPSGITVNCIAPGVIDTEMNGSLPQETVKQLQEETPLGSIGTPADIAYAALYLAGEHAGFITGQVWSINGGLVI